ncbi:MAG TPA: GNAT family protein [Mycobacterium sp.]|nr:GNAT family protein [Mycobacterium sp.]
MTNVRLLPATVEHLVTLQSDPSAFGRLIGSPVPDGWPEFPESIGFTIDRLRERPEQADWWMHFFLAGDVLVGSGGYVGPPQDGAVEFGYEVAPAFRGKGLGIAAARAMVDKAVASGVVSTVIAHTLAHDNPSTGVLRRLGFTKTRDLVDPEDGPIWRWELPLTAW